MITSAEKTEQGAEQKVFLLRPVIFENNVFCMRCADKRPRAGPYTVVTDSGAGAAVFYAKNTKFCVTYAPVYDIM